MVIVPGDFVTIGEDEMIVVDITHDEDGDWAVLRSPADLEGQNLIAKPAGDLTATGHADRIEGWVEDAPGEWRQA